ncbi:MAG: DUF6455 family protein [Gemmobacter sp.]
MPRAPVRVEPPLDVGRVDPGGGPVGLRPGGVVRAGPDRAGPDRAGPDRAGSNRDGGLMPVMARLTGADLAAALEDGRLSAASLAGARRRCAACLQAPQCIDWMAGQVGRALPPAFCGNGPFFGSVIWGER